MPVVATLALYTRPTVPNASTGEGIGGLGEEGRVTYAAIRRFLRDSPANNFLNNFKVDYSDDEIEQGMLAACSEFNTMAPIRMSVKFDGSDWPRQAPHLLILGTCAWLLKGTASHQLRNQFNAQDGNIPHVGVYDKFPQFLSYAQTLQQEFRDGVAHLKQLLDFESASRRSHSPLARRRAPWYGG